MSDDSVSTPTNIDTEVSAPISSSKPYDDDMMEAYAEDIPEGDGGGSNGVQQEGNGEAPKTDPNTDNKDALKENDQKDEAEPARAKEGDKVDDGFEKVPVKRQINGKEVEFTVEQAIEAFVSKETFNRDMDRRSTALAQKAKQWDDKVQKFKGDLGKIVEKAQGGDLVTALRGIAKIATNGTGLDQVKFEEMYFSQLDKIREVLTKMSPEQQKAYWAERRATVAEDEARKLRDEKTTHTEISQLQNEVAAVQQRYKIDDQEFWGNYKYLVDNVLGEGKVFESKDQITTEEVVKYTFQVRHERKIDEAGRKAGVTDEEHLDAISQAILATGSEMSVDEIAEWIVKTGQVKTASATQVENLNRKAGQSRFSQGSSTKKENGIPEGYDEETLEELYRRQPKVVKRPVR